MEFSSKTSKGAFAETMEMVEDDFYKFNEIINHNLKMESDIEKQLEKEDKKCTFLKNTIEKLKKQRDEAERTLNEQRKYIFDKQMELEEISTTIYEQMEILGIGNSKEGVTFHLDMVKAVQKTIDYVKNFKVILQNDIDECIHQNVEVDHWKTQSKECLRRIAEFEAVKNKLREEIDEKKNQNIERSLENINQHAQQLQEIRQEYKYAQNQLIDILTQKRNLEKRKQQKILESQKMKDELLHEYDHCQRLNELYSDKTVFLQTEITEVNEIALKTYQELKNLIRDVKKGLEKYDSAIEEKTTVLNDLKKQENSLKVKNLEITSNIEKLTEELSKLKMSNNMLKDQQELVQNMLNTIRLHTNSIERSTTEYEIQSENLTKELMKLKNDNTSIIDCMGKTNQKNDPLLFEKNETKNELESSIIENSSLEKEHKQLKQEIIDLQRLEIELKNKICVYEAEQEFLDVLLTQTTEKQRETITEADEKIEECIENVNELGNNLFEKNLLLDAIKIDVQKCRNLISSYEYKILAQTKENDDKSARLNQIKESIFNEEKNLQSKINLLQDLERNTFSRNHIPPEWLQTFEKHRVEYEQIKTQRLTLEGKRNKSSLISKFDSEIKKNKNDIISNDVLFESNDEGKPDSILEAKNAAFKMFKERIMKKNKTLSSS